MDPFFRKLQNYCQRIRCNGQCLLDSRLQTKAAVEEKRVKAFQLAEGRKQVPLLFLAANGNKPYQLNVKTFTKPMKGKKNTREFAAKKLVKHVAKVSKPKVWQILKPSDFKSIV